MDSILTCIKQMLGIDENTTQFDPEIVVNINSALFILCQLGVGPENGYSITDKVKTWTDYLGADANLESVKLYIYFKCRLGFDPPSNSYVVDAIEKQISELECRINYQVDKPAPVVATTTNEEVLY